MDNFNKLCNEILEACDKEDKKDEKKKKKEKVVDTKSLKYKKIKKGENPFKPITKAPISLADAGFKIGRGGE